MQMYNPLNSTNATVQLCALLSIILISTVLFVLFSTYVDTDLIITRIVLLVLVILTPLFITLKYIFTGKL